MSNFKLPSFTEQEIIEKRNKRLFSVPYNNSNPDEYFNIIKPYLKNIDSVYFEYPGLIDNHASKRNISIDDIIENRSNTELFLRKYGFICKCVITINNCFYPMTQTECYNFVLFQLQPVLKAFPQIKSAIVSDFQLACCIRKICPNIGIQTSCNTYQFNNVQMKRWNDILNIELFNPPRESLRNIEMLEQFRQTNFKLKYIVNEGCVYGCPQQINHACYISTKTQIQDLFCDNQEYKYRYLLQSNWILPRWLKYLDNYVDVFKLSGRLEPNKAIKNILDAYINERNDVDLFSIITTRQNTIFKKQNPQFKINVNLIPDKLLMCKCEECDACNICLNVMKSLLKKNNVDDITKI